MALYLGAADYLTYQTSGLSDTTCTITFWFRQIADGNYVVSFDGGDWAQYRVTTGSQVGMDVGTPGGSSAFTATAYTNGDWAFGAIVLNGSTWVAYRGDLSGALESASGNLGTPNFTQLHIGYSSFAEEWDGDIAGIKIWNNVALSEAQILQERMSYWPSRLEGLYAWLPLRNLTERETDYSGLGNDLEEVGILVQATTDPPVGWIHTNGRLLAPAVVTSQSMTTDGDFADRLTSTAGTFTLASNWSWCGWIKPTTLAGTPKHGFGLYTNFAPIQGVTYWDSLSTTALFWSSEGVYEDFPGGQLSGGGWVFFGASHDDTAGQTTLYRKNEEGTLQSVVVTDASYAGSWNEFVVGGHGTFGGDGGIPGSYAFLKMWTAALSPTDMATEASYGNPQRAADLDRFYALQTLATYLDDTGGSNYDLTNTGTAWTMDPDGPNLDLDPSAFSGVGATTVPSFQASASGTLTLEGAGATAVPSFQASSSGALSFEGIGLVATAPFQVAGTGNNTLNYTGSANVALAAFQVNASGLMLNNPWHRGAIESLYGHVLVFTSWTNLKGIAVARDLDDTIQYEEYVDFYKIFLLDAQFVWHTVIFKGAIPQATDYTTQLQNDLDKYDFEFNYYNVSNQRLSPWLYDVNASAGIEKVLGVSLRKSAPGGSVELGTEIDPLVVIPVQSTTPVVTSVSASVANQTFLASNADRKGATIQNDSSAILFLKLGATASPTSYTVRMVSQAYYEVPYGYTGRVDGVWDAAAGAARITELT